MVRKGSVLLQERVEREEIGANGTSITRMRPEIVVRAIDMIGDEFWLERPALLMD